MAMAASESRTVSTPFAYATTIKSYKFLRKIGQGAFASVWSARTTSSELVAVKVLNLDHVDSDLKEIRNEVQLMRLSLHPNVLFCHTAFLEMTQLFVVMPLMNKGSSVSCLQQARKMLLQKSYSEPLPSLEPHILYILQQTLCGLQYIHENGQIHRDIKGGNILLNEDGEVKIADFGVSGWLIPQNEKAKTFVGTPCWMAPEVMEQLHGYDYKADLWSLGITALELAKGYAPYANFAPMQVLIRTIQEEPPSLDTYDQFESPQNDIYPQEWSSRFRELVSLLLQKNPSVRPTCQDVLQQDAWWSTAVTSSELANDICAHIPSIGKDNTESLDDGDDASIIWNTESLLSSSSQSPADRAPGTTWVFSDDDRTLLPADSEDGLNELDEFCSAIGGEHYQKDEMESASVVGETEKPAITWMEEYQIEKISDTIVEDDGLDEFLDEFEKTTSGENFQRRIH